MSAQNFSILIILLFRPSGEAVAEFESEDDARSAMGQNRAYMGERFIVLTPQGFKD